MESEKTRKCNILGYPCRAGASENRGKGAGEKPHIRFRTSDCFIVLVDPDPQGSKPVEASDQSMKR